MPKKYTTVAVPVDVSSEYVQLFPDVPLSLFVRATVRNLIKLSSKYDASDVLQIMMFGDVART